jgi:hypothetical protein
MTPDAVGGTVHSIISLCKYMRLKCSLKTDATMSVAFGDAPSLISNIGLQPSTRYHVLIKRSLAQGMALKVNNVVVATNTYTGDRSPTTNYNSLDFGRSETQTEYYDGSMELLKFFNIWTSDGADNSLYEEAMTI